MTRHHLALHWLAAVLAAVLGASLVAGCDRAASVIASAQPPTFKDQTAPAVQMGSGTTPAGPWTGWLYPTAGGACVVVVENGRPGEPVCTFGSEPFDGDIGVSSSGTQDGSMAYGSSTEPTAEVAAITLGTGEVVRVPIVRPGGPVANGNGYFMARFGAGSAIRLITVRDARDAELGSYPVGR